MLNVKECCNPLVMSAVGEERETCVNACQPFVIPGAACYLAYGETGPGSSTSWSGLWVPTGMQRENSELCDRESVILDLSGSTLCSSSVFSLPVSL